MAPVRTAALILITLAIVSFVTIRTFVNQIRNSRLVTVMLREKRRIDVGVRGVEKDFEDIISDLVILAKSYALRLYVDDLNSGGQTLSSNAEIVSKVFLLFSEQRRTSGDSCSGIIDLSRWIIQPSGKGL